jgi:hypothetical protein
MPFIGHRVKYKNTHKNTNFVDILLKSNVLAVNAIQQLLAKSLRYWGEKYSIWTILPLFCSNWSCDFMTFRIGYSNWGRNKCLQHFLGYVPILATATLNGQNGQNNIQRSSEVDTTNMAWRTYTQLLFCAPSVSLYIHIYTHTQAVCL